MYDKDHKEHPREYYNDTPIFCWRAFTRPFKMFHPIVWLLLGCLLSTMVLTKGPSYMDFARALSSHKLSRYEHEVRLIEYLKGRAEVHGTDVYPSESGVEPAKIYFGVSLLFIEDLVNHRLGYGDATFHCVDRYLWQDDRLKWDPADYGGTTLVRIPIRHIWAPDIRLLNSLDTSNNEDRDGTLAIIYSSGKVLFIPPAKHRVRCTRNTTKKKGKLGHDWQCTMKFASWTHDGRALDPDFYPGKDPIDMSDFQQKMGRLKVVHSFAERKVDRQYKDPYPDLEFTVMLKEKTDFIKKPKKSASAKKVKRVQPKSKDKPKQTSKSKGKPKGKGKKGSGKKGKKSKGKGKGRR